MNNLSFSRSWSLHSIGSLFLLLSDSARFRKDCILSRNSLAKPPEIYLEFSIKFGKVSEIDLDFMWCVKSQKRLDFLRYTTPLDIEWAGRSGGRKYFSFLFLGFPESFYRCLRPFFILLYRSSRLLIVFSLSPSDFNLVLISILTWLNVPDGPGSRKRHSSQDGKITPCSLQVCNGSCTVNHYQLTLCTELLERHVSTPVNLSITGVVIPYCSCFALLMQNLLFIGSWLRYRTRSLSRP